MRKVCYYIMFVCLVFISCVKTEVDTEGGLIGTVRDGTTNKTISNCFVAIDSLKLMTYTDNNGMFEFEKLSIGKYTLTFKATNYQTLNDIVFVKLGEKTQKDVFMNKVGVPNVLSSPATEITYNSAKLNANVIQDGGAEITSCGFYWGTSTSNMSKVSASPGQSFIYELKGLQENTQYLFKAFAVNSNGEGLGSITSFTTNISNKPIVETIEAINITGVSATLRANIISSPKTGVNSIGFYFGKDSTNLNQTLNVISSGSTSFSYDINDLEDNVTYYYRAFMLTNDGNAVGDIIEFKTNTITLPQVTCNSATLITETSATFNGELLSIGNDPTTEYGFIYGKTQSKMSSKIKVGNGTIGKFDTNITGLRKLTTYYYKSYASNKKGTSYGSVMTFKTPNFNGHEFVDLGLPSGNLWATMNIGASAIKESGNYYFWATSLATFVDIAKQEWGGTWTMPTLDDMKELVTYCSKTHRSYTVGNVTTQWDEWTGPNGNMITLPNGGIYHVEGGYTYWENKGSGYFWTCTPGPDVENYPYKKQGAYLLNTQSSSSKTQTWPINLYKANIRPVSK